MLRGRQRWQARVAGTTSPPKTRRRSLLSCGPEETRAFGEALGRCLRPGDLLLLEGPLGAGKTCLAQGVAVGLGVRDYVKSPSFTLVNEYRSAAGFPLIHIDLYRIAAPEEVYSLGLDEYLVGNGVCIVEWAERAASVFPPEYLRIVFTMRAGNRRTLILRPRGQRYESMVEELSCSWP